MHLGTFLERRNLKGTKKNVYIYISKVHDAVVSWKTELQSKNRTKIADRIADPLINSELFQENWDGALKREMEMGISGEERGEEGEEEEEEEKEEEEEEEESGEEE